MPRRWQSLYLSCVDAPHTTTASIITTVQNALTNADYTLYDPFNALSFTSYAQTVKLFVAPIAEGWCRVIVDALPTMTQAALLAQLSAGTTALAITLDAEQNPAQHHVHIYRDGQTAARQALAPYLRNKHTLEDVQRALSQQARQGTSHQPGSTMPLDALPDEYRTMAETLSDKHMGKLFDKLMRRVGKKVGGDQNAARDLLQGGVDWESQAAIQITQFMQCLTIPQGTIPQGWRWPDFVTLRDAYQLHLRRQRNPQATLYPGDAEAMNAVPNALAYTPIYAGKDGGKES